MSWVRQQDKPLFEDILWARPENKAQAGKLLIIGGNSHSFAAPAQAYNIAQQAGIGVARVLLPDATKKQVLPFFPEASYTSSTPSGSFAKNALGEWLAEANWADGVLLAGDFGRNSETAIVLEQFVKKYGGILTITKDALDYFKNIPSEIMHRPDTVVVGSLSQLQKLVMKLGIGLAIRFEMDLIQLTGALEQLTYSCPATILTVHNDHVLVANGGNVSSTPLSKEKSIWRLEVAAAAVVFALQNPSKPFEAITSAIYTVK